MRDHFLPITDDFIFQKAKELGSPEYYGVHGFNFSNGWLYRFKLRYRISLRSIHGESGEIDERIVDTERKNYKILPRTTTPMISIMLTRQHYFINKSQTRLWLVLVKMLMGVRFLKID